MREESVDIRLRGAKKYDYFIILPDDPFKVSCSSHKIIGTLGFRKHSRFTRGVRHYSCSYCVY